MSVLSEKRILQHVARVEGEREGDAQVQPGHDQKQGQQPQRPAMSQPVGVLEPGVQRLRRRDRHDRQEGEVKGLVGQTADQLQPAVAFGLGQLLGRHAGRFGCGGLGRRFGCLLVGHGSGSRMIVYYLGSCKLQLQCPLSPPGEG